MGCTLDNYSVRLEKKDYIEKFINEFNEILKEELYLETKISKDDCTIEKDKEGYWFWFEGEPLFNTPDGEDISDYFVKEYIKKYPKESFSINYQCTYNNSSEATDIKYIYNSNTKILNIKRVYGEDSGIFMCPECEAEFLEAIVYLENYDENKQYFCPECGEEISFDVSIITETKTLEEILEDYEK